jgi:hypothetical protein
MVLVLVLVGGFVSATTFPIAAPDNPSCKTYCGPDPTAGGYCCAGCSKDGCEECHHDPTDHCASYCTCSSPDPPTPPPAPTPQFDPSFCPQLHFHGKRGVHDPSAPVYIAATDMWHLFPDVAGGQGHSWSQDLVHWQSDPDYESNALCYIPETGSITVTPSGTYFIYAGLDRDGVIESGAYRAVSTDPVGLSSWVTGPNKMNGSCAAAGSKTVPQTRCPSYPCKANVIPHPTDNPHDFRDPSEAFLHSDGSWCVGSTTK